MKYSKYVDKPDDMWEVIKMCNDKIGEYKLTKNHELEIRLGFFNETEFDTNIPEDFFNKISNVLGDKTNKWYDVRNTKSEDSFHKKLRLTEQDNGIVYCIQKVNIFTIDVEFEGTPFDLRISFSEEKTIKVDKFNKDKVEFKRFKDRITYVYKYMNFDITKVTSEYNTLTSKSRNIELEVRDIKNSLKDYDMLYLIHGTLLKVIDLVNICETITDECKLKIKKDN